MSTIDTAGTDLVVAQTADEAALALRGQMTVAITDPVAVQRQIVENILEADNADDILGTTSNTVQGTSILGQPFTLNGVQILKSGKKGGLGVFAVLDATLNGKDAKITTGAGNVMAQAVALWKRDLLPIDVQIVEAEDPTAAGFKPQRLVAA